jgi:hypothetical protein
MEWTEILPASLMDERFRAGLEYAWPKTLAIDAAQHLGSQGFAVVALEVWRAVKPFPRLSGEFVYRWEATDPSPGEPWGAYVRRVTREAVNYIGDFRWAGDDTGAYNFEPHFCFVVFRPEDVGLS